MSLVVLKFGGSSLATLARISHVADIILSHRKRGEQVAVVVSAMANVTDDLLKLAQDIGSSFCGREQAALLATGEMQSSCLLAMALLKRNVKAKSFNAFQLSLLGQGGYADSVPQQMDTSRIKNCLQDDWVPIVTGFQGINDAGDLVNFGRSGSDTSAVFLAGSLGASRCDIYTDVEGVMSADPRIVSDAKCLPEVPIDIMQTYATMGAYVLHPSSVMVAKKMGIDVRVLSSFGRSQGSCIVSDGDLSKPKIYGLNRQRGFSMIRILKRYDCEAGQQRGVRMCTDGKYAFYVGEEKSIKWLSHAINADNDSPVAVASFENIDRIVLVGVQLQEFEAIFTYMRKYAVYPELIAHDAYSMGVYVEANRSKQILDDLHSMAFSDSNIGQSTGLM